MHQQDPTTASFAPRRMALALLIALSLHGLLLWRSGAPALGAGKSLAQHDRPFATLLQMTLRRPAAIAPSPLLPPPTEKNLQQIAPPAALLQRVLPAAAQAPATPQPASPVGATAAAPADVAPPSSVSEPSQTAPPALAPAIAPRPILPPANTTESTGATETKRPEAHGRMQALDDDDLSEVAPAKTLNRGGGGLYSRILQDAVREQFDEGIRQQAGGVPANLRCRFAIVWTQRATEIRNLSCNLNGYESFITRALRPEGLPSPIAFGLGPAVVRMTARGGDSGFQLD